MERLRISGFVACAALAVLAFTPSQEPRPLDLGTPEQTAHLGLVSDGTGTSLVRISPVSLKRSGRAFALNGFGGPWVVAPDGRLLAVGVRRWSESSIETLRFYTVAGPHRSGKGVPLGGVAAALAWTRPDRILAYVNVCCPNPQGAGTVLTIDPRARRVVARTEVDGSVLHIARGTDSLVLLVGEANRIGSSRLVVVDSEGAVRSVDLEQIHAGMTWPEQGGGDPIGTRLVPGLAVDAPGQRALVIAPDGVVAVVDLGSLAVSYHRLAAGPSPLDRIAGWLTATAEAKGVNGPALVARWLGDGLMGVAGSDGRATQENGKLRVSMQPLGLRIVDTRDWSVRTLDAGADSFTVANGVLLATGSSWSSDPQSQSGMGVAAYGPDRNKRFQLLPGRPVWVGFVYRGRAFVSVADESRLRVVDLGSGRIVGSRRPDAPWPLLGDSFGFF